MSLLITLGDAPLIRYHNRGPSELPEKLARILSKQIDDVKKNDESYPQTNDFKKAILIIVDRRFDVMAPFLHEFTYQAMFNDLVCGERSKLPFH
jgi:syntaxin-binding protein 1